MGQKDPTRKGKRRPRPKEIDDDLVELASVLAEYQLDNNAYGWFRPPWRNGLAASMLALHASAIVADSSSPQSATRDRGWALIELARAGCIASPYEEAGEIYRSLIQPKINTSETGLLAVAMRCLQLYLANSDGGGAVYNELLIPAFLPIEPALVADIVLQMRCLDAIGTTHLAQGDRNDRQRAAFTTAWRRGLYLAAYSIPPAF